MAEDRARVILERGDDGVYIEALPGIGRRAGDRVEVIRQDTSGGVVEESAQRAEDGQESVGRHA